MARLSYEKLQSILKQENCSRWWSWSKINCFHTSPYEYYLKYIKKSKEDRANSIYVTTGGLAHTILEKYYTGEIPYEKMLEEFEDGWMVAADIADLKFDRTNEEKNMKIKDKYYLNLVHFFKNHTILENKPIIEQFIKIKINNNLFQGYLDCVFKDSNNNIHIVDFKTSSIYKGSKAENECGQLVLYAIGLHQQGIPYENIRICWNFLKYVTIQYEQKNGDIKTREVERCNIGESLQANAGMWLKYFNYEPDEYLKQLLDTNDINVLPSQVRDKYAIADCYVYVPITKKLIDKWTTHVATVIKDIVLREKDYEETHSDMCFYDTDDSVKANSYYFANLCGYSRLQHKPYDRFLNIIEQQKNGLSLFNDANFTSKSVDINNEADLSWLENL